MENCTGGFYDAVASVENGMLGPLSKLQGNVFVWRKNKTNNIVPTNTGRTLEYFVKEKILFVYLDGKNNYDDDITNPNEKIINDGKTITFNMRYGLAKVDIGLLSRVSNIKWGEKGTVLVTKKVVVSDISNYDTELTIEQLIEQKKLFVCDTSQGMTTRIVTQNTPYDNKRPAGMGGGKRNKSRKPNRRISRSKRRKTLNKSKK